MSKSHISCWALCWLLACASPQKEEHSGHQQTFRDELGRTVVYHPPVRRALPLCASSLETLVEFCDTAQVIGRTPEVTDARFAGKPVVSNYPLDIEQLIALKPDLLVSKEGMLGNDQLQKLEELGLPVYMQKADNIPGIASGIRQLSRLTGHAEKGEQVASDFLSDFKQLTAQARPHGTALVVISSDPIYVFGYASYLSDVLVACGLKNAVDSSLQQAFPLVDQEYLLTLDPDYLILPEQQKVSQELFEKHPLLKRLKAYRHAHCLYVNGDDLSRPGVRLVPLAHSIVRQLPSHNEKR